MVYQLDYLSGNYAAVIQLKTFTTLTIILLLMTTVIANICESDSRVYAFQHYAIMWYALYFFSFVKSKQSTFQLIKIKKPSKCLIYI